MRISDWSSYVCSSDLRWLKMSLRLAYRSRRSSVLSALKLESCKRWKPSASSTYATSNCRHRRRRKCQSHATRHGGTANPPTASRAALRIIVVGPATEFPKTNVAKASRPDMSRSEEHTSELQSLMRISYAVFCVKKKTTQ